MLEEIKSAKIGDIIPICKEIKFSEPKEVFAKISDYGREENCIFYETNEKAIFSANPCLKIKGSKKGFQINALNLKGSKFLSCLKTEFKFCDKVKYTKNKITGEIKSPKNNTSENKKSKQKTHLDILRKIAFKFSPVKKDKEIIPSSGLFGAFSYDFIEHFENILSEEESKYYEFYYLDNLFLFDKEKEKAYIIANALIFDKKVKNIYNECQKTIEALEKLLKQKIKKAKKPKPKEQLISFDTSKEEYQNSIREIKRNIVEGNIYKAYLARKAKTNINSEPFEIFNKLVELKPRTFKFYINTKEDTLMGSTPEISLKVSGEKEKKIKVPLIARTKPTGKSKNSTKDLENKYELELMTDFKEISKHIMAIDVVRSDIAKVSKTGSRGMDKIFETEKYSKEQNLVSSVSGILKKNLDSLDAYKSCMNRLSGTPRIETIKLLARLEKSKRNYFFGTVCYLTPCNNFEGAVIKNSIRIKEKDAEFFVNTEIVYDSLPEEEYKSSIEKSETFLKAIKSAGGLK